MNQRNAKKFEVGAHDGKVGFAVTYEDNTKQHFLFQPRVAVKLANLLTKVSEVIDQISTENEPEVGLVEDVVTTPIEQPQGHVEKLGVTESVSVGLTDPKKLH